LQSLGFLTLGERGDSGHLVGLSLALGAHDSAAPVLPDLLGSLVVVGLHGLDDFGELLLVLVLDINEGDGSALLSADELSESGLTLDNAVWNVHLSAESWQVDDDFEWVDVVGDQDELGLLSLDQVDYLVDTAGQGGWSWGWGVGLALDSCLSAGHQSSLFVGFALTSVFGGELKNLGGVLLVNGLVELVDAWWHLQSLLENDSLSLELDVLWPSHESSQVFLWLEILANAKVLGSLLEEWVVSLLLRQSLGHWGGGRSLSLSHHF